MEDQIVSLLPVFATLTAVVWACTEFLPRAIPWLSRMPKEFTALVMGLALGPAAVWAGLLSVSYPTAIVMGFISTVVAGYVNDKGINPLKRKETP